MSLLPLHLATMWGHAEAVEMLLQYDVLHTHGRAHTPTSIVTDLSGAAPAQTVSTPGGSIDSESVREYLRQGTLPGSIDIPDEGGHTALHLACVYGEAGAARVLLRFGANITSIDQVSLVSLPAGRPNMPIIVLIYIYIYIYQYVCVCLYRCTGLRCTSLR